MRLVQNSRSSGIRSPDAWADSNPRRTRPSLSLMAAPKPGVHPTQLWHGGPAALICSVGQVNREPGSPVCRCRLLRAVAPHRAPTRARGAQPSQPDSHARVPPLPLTPRSPPDSSSQHPTTTLSLSRLPGCPCCACPRACPPTGSIWRRFRNMPNLFPRAQPPFSHFHT